MDSTNYNLYLNRYKEMLKTAHHLSQLLKKTREENEYLRKCIETKNSQKSLDYYHVNIAGQKMELSWLHIPTSYEMEKVVDLSHPIFALPASVFAAMRKPIHLAHLQKSQGLRCGNRRTEQPLVNFLKGDLLQLTQSSKGSSPSSFPTRWHLARNSFPCCAHLLPFLR